MRVLSRLCLLVSLSAAAITCQAGDKYTLTVGGLQVPTGESIVSFEIHLVGARFCDVSNLPLGWGLVIDNDPSWHTSFKGNVEVGAAWLTPDEFGKLQFLIEKSDDPELKLAYSGTIAATKNYDKTATIPLKTSNFKLTPAH